MQKVHISIEGNIGVGKTTIVENLNEHFERDNTVSCAFEPLDEWESSGFLEDMYSKKIDHAEFQNIVISSMFHTSFVGLSKSDILIQERSMDAAFEVFTKNNVQNPRSLELLKYSYNKLKKSIEEAFSVKTIRIYLRVPPLVAFSRVSGRSRSSESKMSEEYITAINDAYEDWLLSDDTSETVIQIDASRSIEEVTHAVMKQVSSIIHPNGLEPKKLFQ
jgi:deoxyadenosine/deoxycytidine kinase